ncbi:MAG: DJ-1/PfpI/YhbO family deglycase/protease [Desulfurococcales archaeon]|jgi:protease I|nr:type 1 glutamine amidotransferase [Desulfurococcaceae archaeon]NAZ13887.1 DJ-1/PfpI/YhbO family deglycase/protease [Desulfurococcales archaeon]
MSKKILIIVGSEFEDIEVLYPYYRLIEEGYEVTIAAPEDGRITGKHGYSVDAIAFNKVRPEEYVGLVIPGGRGPERIRASAREAAVKIVRHFIETGKPIAAICHGPQLLISAGAVKGLKLTSYPGIADDMIVAGGVWLDQPVVVDKNIVTARVPADIPMWMREFVKLLKKI